MSSKPQINVLFYSLQSTVEKYLNKIALTAGAIMQQNAYLVGSYPVLGALLIVSPLILASYYYPQECIHSKTFTEHIFIPDTILVTKPAKLYWSCLKGTYNLVKETNTDISCCSPG